MILTVLLSPLFLCRAITINREIGGVIERFSDVKRIRVLMTNVDNSTRVEILIPESF
jgi:hypothetical protein